MASTYTGNIGLAKPAFGDTGWDVAMNNNADDIDALSPIGGLCVRPAEIPSVSLNVQVAPGDYPNSDGSIGSFAGESSQAIPASTTQSLWLDPTGTLTLGTSYPTTSAYVPLATVVAGSTTISGIQDDRVPGGLVLRTLVNATNDAAAATAGVQLNCLYRNGSVVMVRVT